ncbi:hypothetical protein ACFXKD_00415 [Nocardiopsis aegyptia]|uniref:hypothetical protein n=1 Tax=Nocardiopsis aegyptia TaxID=220378 RepID=UPI00366CBB53
MATNKTALQRSTTIKPHERRWQMNSFVKCELTVFIVKVKHGEKRDGAPYTLLRVKAIATLKSGEQKTRFYQIFVPEHLMDEVKGHFPESRSVNDALVTLHMRDASGGVNNYKDRTFGEVRWELDSIDFKPAEDAGREYLTPEDH